MEKIGIAIIGGGAIGMASAYKILEAMPQASVAVLEKNKHLGEEQSGRNSGVVHAGIYYRSGSKKAIHCIRGNRELYSFCLEQGIPVAKTGKIIVATNDLEKSTLEFLLENGKRNGATELELISQEEVKQLEPNVDGFCALYSPTTGIIDAAAYVNTLGRLVKKNGGLVFCNAEVKSFSAGKEGTVLTVKQGEEQYYIEAAWLVNAAGLHAETVGRMVNPNFLYRTEWWQGEYMKFNSCSRAELAMRGLNVYPTPKIIPGLFDGQGNPKLTLGTHLTPTFEYDAEGKARLGRTVLVGPKGHLLGSKVTKREQLKQSDFSKDLEAFYPHIISDDLTEEMVGIQVKLVGYDDFVIEKDRKYQHCIHVIADSPGLTASLAIGEEVARLVNQL